MDEISYDDFLKLDLRIAIIESTESIPGKTRIMKGIISLGDEKRDVIIGGANFYDPDELVGRLVVVVANLETKKMAGVESFCQMDLSLQVELQLRLSKGC